MTSKNMTRRKVVALASDTSDIYAVADDGTVWCLNGIQWHPLASLPHREDEALPQSELVEAWRDLPEATKQRNALRIEVAQLRADLRRVREAVREALLPPTTNAADHEALNALHQINKEPMP